MKVRVQLKIIILIGLIISVEYNIQSQVPEELRPSTASQTDLSTSKNLLQLKTGYRGAIRLDLGVNEYRGTSKWALGYEKSLNSGIIKNWWSFKADTRVYEFNSGKVESRMLLTHSRQMNNFIKMKSNWGFGYGTGFYPTYMMGLTFDLTKQWHLIPYRSRGFSKPNRPSQIRK